MQLPIPFHATGYNPHAGQLRFHESSARFKVLIAGARFGKSLAAAKDILPDLLAGPVRGWLVAPTYALAQPEFRYIVEDLRDRLGLPVEVKDGGRTGPSMLRLPWGAEVHCLSAQRPETLLGEEIDWLILCEAAHLDSEAFMRYLRGRLTTRRGRLLVPTTPRGFNWIHRLYDLGLKDDGEWQSFRFPTWANPLIAPEEIESARKALPPEVFDEQYGGAFTSPAGAVYREFQPAMHVVPELAVPPGSIIYKSIDFGFTNPLCCLWAARDGDGRLLVLREHYLDRQVLDTHMQAIRAIDDEFTRQGNLLGPVIADPSGSLERRMLAAGGITTQPAINDVPGGIAAVRRMLAPREDGTPGMYIDARCVNLVREFGLYEWQESSRPGERVPRKDNDHALDALRYLCTWVQRGVDWKKQGAAW